MTVAMTMAMMIAMRRWGMLTETSAAFSFLRSISLKTGKELVGDTKLAPRIGNHDG